MPSPAVQRSCKQVVRLARPRATTVSLVVVAMMVFATTAGCRGTQPQHGATTQSNSLAQADTRQQNQPSGGSTQPPGDNAVSQASAVDLGANGAAADTVVAHADQTTPTNQTVASDKRASPAAQPPVGQLQTLNKDQAMADVQDELQAIKAIDPIAQQRLLTEMQTVRPDQWSLMVQQFQSALAFRQQLVAREARLARQTGSDASTADTPVVTAIKHDTHEPRQVAPDASTQQADEQPVRLPHADTPANIRLISTGKENLSTGKENLSTGKENLSTGKENQVTAGDLAHKIATQLAASAPTSQQQHAAILLTPPPEQPSAYAVATNPRATANQPSVGQPGIFDRVISALEQSVTNTPGSTDDIHQHMRLRMLYLLAGRQEEAYQPIPGATPAQQDYWSKQLFAMATYLDNRSQPDNKRRSAAALAYLDDARGMLSELATLQVRNLTFVASVDGYGAYQPLQQSTFQPGEQVTLYAEVENFHSESTEAGYSTSLSTSYQVVDKSGKRVDGGQFPDVIDQCKNRRRDFHIQYGIALPTGIYPENYELQLIVTDNQSGKIGQATLPFTIADKK